MAECFRYMLALALVGKLCSLLFFFFAWWFYRPPAAKNNNAVSPAADLVLHDKSNGTLSTIANGTLDRNNGYCNAALECSDHI